MKNKITVGYMLLGAAFIGLTSLDIREDRKERRRIKEFLYQKQIDDKFENIMVANYMK